MDELTIRKGDDLHCHLRRGEILKSVIGFTASQFKRALIMPNTSPEPILTAKDALGYRREILAALPKERGFKPLMTIQINDFTTPEIIRDASRVGVVAGKVYPLGVTTNSGNGVSDFDNIYPVFEQMQKSGMIVSIHGESADPKVFCLDREIVFLDTLIKIANDFPELKIVLEHVSTREAVEAVRHLSPNVAATITVHHLYLSLDEVVGNLIEPHNFCKPIAKRPEDRQALQKAALSGDSKFFYGGDSAPHLRAAKESGQGPAGVFNAPVALPMLVQFFEENGAPDKIEGFLSFFGAKFYGLPIGGEKITLIRKEWIVPEVYDGIAPFMAGKRLNWQVEQSS